jgi:hypothetical protein
VLWDSSRATRARGADPQSALRPPGDRAQSRAGLRQKKSRVVFGSRCWRVPAPAHSAASLFHFSCTSTP